MAGRFQAVVFDLDGVLWDGEPLYHRALNAVLRPLGHALDYETYTRSVAGLSVEECWEWARDRFGLPQPLAELLAAYHEAVLGLLRNGVQPLPGVRRLVGRLRAVGVPLAVASSSRREWVEATLQGLGLEGAFQAVVTASDVERAKPAPDLYLAAARLLQVPPQRCIAIEDTPTGLRAAKAAGMLAVQLRAASSSFPPEPEADLVLDSLCHFDLDLLQAGTPTQRG
ncbi:MAG TPA: HAD family phosphatase [Dehalococcoidia bacterium]|nr:HAD family phosphatase [Dehalococcoidia bacterium]